jgi:hypothetical protein
MISSATISSTAKIASRPMRFISASLVAGDHPLSPLRRRRLPISALPLMSAIVSSNFRDQDIGFGANDTHSHLKYTTV